MNMINEKVTAESPFGFKDDSKRVSTVSMDYLRNSSMILDSKGSPLKTRPVQSWELFEDLTETIERHSINSVSDDIYVDRSSSTKRMTREEREQYKDKKAPIKYWVFNDLISRVVFPKTADDETDGSVAIAFNSNGIQVAFGLNVRICSNMDILSGNIMRSYGVDKISYNDMLLNINEWLSNLDRLVKVEMGIMNSLKDKKIWTIDMPEEAYELMENQVIGTLYKKAVFQNYFDNKDNAPLNQHNVSKFCQKMINKRSEHIERGEFNAWDLYNIGTSIIRPGNLDTKHIIDNSHMLVVAIMEMFNIENSISNA